MSHHGQIIRTGLESSFISVEQIGPKQPPIYHHRTVPDFFNLKIEGPYGYTSGIETFDE